MNRTCSAVGLGLVLVASCVCAAATIQVGPTRTYTTVAAGYNAANTGDTIEIDSGTYTGASGACVSISKNNLTIRGVGPTRPVLDAAGGNVGDKGIFVVYATNLTVENLEMKNTVGPSGNDAGIRYQPSSSPSSLTVRSCYIHDNQDGILGGDSGSTMLFEDTEFSHNGIGDGYTHNIYVGPNTFTMRYCYSHDTNEGHEVKTRASTNYILYNLLSSELGTGSRELQIANGGVAYVIGNVIQQGPNSDNGEIITYGGEGTNTPAYLYVVNNTIINLRPNGGTFLQKNNSTTAALFENNIVQWYGNETLIGGSGVTQTTNWITTNAHLVNIAAHDYHLTAASTGAIDAGTAPGTGYNSVSLVPIYQPVIPCSQETRPTDSTIDIGAYEYVANRAPTVNAGADQSVVEGQPVSLHATASDPDNDPLTYAWTQPAGLPVVLTGGATASASFTAPTVATIAQAAMTFTATVSDGRGGLASDSVNVRVYMLGDINQDDSVDVVDLLTFVAAFGSVTGDANYSATCDFNNDGGVDVIDLLIFVGNFGRTIS